ncbi:MAG: hypothetical protein UMV23_02565 [Halanaerobium sp.]|nr:hypothetical protein [Halanaerobium sp.]
MTILIIVFYGLVGTLELLQLSLQGKKREILTYTLVMALAFILSLLLSIRS